MTAKTALFFLAGSIGAVLLAIGGFNYGVDPECYYRCEDVDASRKTLNTYYRVAQKLQAFPDTEIVILGSSRGETTPPLWMQSVSGVRTLNLSAAGSELSTKLTFIKIAEEKTRLRKVIWFADYFELIGETVDAKLTNTPALRKYLKGQIAAKGFQQRLKDLQSLIDHNTLEASLYFLNNQKETEINQGSGSEIDYESCLSPQFKGKETPESLQKEVALLYQNYVSRVLPPLQSQRSLEVFKSEMIALAQKKIEVVVVIPPYHPEFLRRLKIEHKDIFDRHQSWILEVLGLASKGIQVRNYFDGIPGDDGSPGYWNDGVHFTCRGAIQMLK